MSAEGLTDHPPLRRFLLPPPPVPAWREIDDESTVTGSIDAQLGS